MSGLSDDKLKKLLARQSKADLVRYRALLLHILESKRSKAYHHAADYLEIAEELATRAALPDKQQELLSHLREKHGRKRSFWSLVSECRQSQTASYGPPWPPMVKGDK